MNTQTEMNNNENMEITLPTKKVKVIASSKKLKTPAAKKVIVEETVTVEETQEDTVTAGNEELELTNRYMYSQIEQSYETMKQIDRVGAFEAEDETGTTFQMLNEVITELKEQFDGEKKEEK